MCKVFAGQDPGGYRQINRSIRVGGHSTSIQLEATFWKLLDEIADNQSMSTPKFISTLYDEALEINGEIPNFASMLRTTCALYLRGLSPDSGQLAASARIRRDLIPGAGGHTDRTAAPRPRPAGAGADQPGAGVKAHISSTW